ncbi:MAG: prolipoprotein diacylglyceryl transferase [Bacteroidales bacterium]|nr:prolipoprotein diacylglyceryl transferase [Bacteroidales bacterium]
MYPTLSEFLKDVFGIDIPLPVQSYGLFVAIAFLVGIWIMIKEMKRKEKQGLFTASEKKVFVGAPAKPKDLIISGIVGFIIGYKLLDIVLRYSLFVDNPGDFILSTDGNFIGGILGAGLSIFFTWRDKEKQKLDKPLWETKNVFPHELAGHILFIAGVVGLLGAKIFHNLENWDDLVADPIGALLTFSGLSFLGGLILGGVAIIWFLKKRKISVIHFADVAAIVLPLGYAIGRLGCQVAGDGCWGVYNEAFANPGTIPAAAYELGHVASFAPPEWLSFLPDWLFAYSYPHNINNEGILMANCTWEHCHALAAPVFPTPLYETTMMLIVFFILYKIRKKIKIPGMLFTIYFIFAGLERFLIEKIRVNNIYKIGNIEITQAELISSFMMIIGIAAVIYLLKNKEKMIAKFGNSAEV